MKFSKINTWVIYSIFTTIICAIVIYSVFLIQELRLREISRIGIFAKAMQMLQDNSTEHSSQTQDLILSILEENNQLPVIITDENKKPILDIGTTRNIPENITQNPKKLEEYISEMEQNYPPFEINLPNNQRQYVFYDNSKLLNNLQYHPYFIGIFTISYLALSLWIMQIMKKKNEGMLWVGLAKETAHQIGTPLSSMIGWLEIIKMEKPNTLGVNEIEQDILRLKTISERFSKIGSIPELNDYNLNETLSQNYHYLKNRISTKIKFTLNLPNEELLIPHNKILFSWVIENLVKNAVDAMKGIGYLSITLYEKNDFIIIDIRDNGCGMNHQQSKNIFNPGFSTKKRGWGLGLSLAKRVVNDYHKGQIYIAHTEISKGTTFRIKLKS